jgi:hypothetical protein
VTVKDNLNAPVAGVPAADIWLIGCNDLIGHAAVAQVRSTPWLRRITANDDHR